MQLCPKNVVTQLPKPIKYHVNTYKVKTVQKLAPKQETKRTTSEVTVSDMKLLEAVSGLETTNENIKLSSFKDSENIQKKEVGTKVVFRIIISLQ